MTIDVRAAAVRLAEAISRRSAYVAVSLSAVVLTSSLSLGSRVASGSDAYGYVSQAELWRKGSLIQPEPLARWFPAGALAPLGYLPARRAFAIVPTYSPGLPLLMALARFIGGPCAIYSVVPITAAAVVLLTYLLCLRVSDQIVAIGATVFVAASPTLLHMMMWPMSDVPACAFWLGALVSATSERRRPRALLTGLLIGIVILIRPNLVPLAVIPIGLVLRKAAGLGRPAIWRVSVALAAGTLPFIVTIAELNTSLYGSPLQSGYGSMLHLYNSAHIFRNLARYTSWLNESQGPYVFAFLVGIAVHLRRGLNSELIWGAAFVCLVIVMYLPYFVFSEWWYLRFLLPALPIIYVLAVEGVAALSARLGPAVRVIVTAIFVAAASAHSLGFAFRTQFISLGEGEQRAAEIGYFVAEALPGNAVLLSVQHSGSIRYYSGRTTLRYDGLDAQLDRTVDVLRAMGYHPYAVLEDAEEPLFRGLFRGQATLRLLEAGPVALLDSSKVVRVYDLAPSGASAGRAVQPIRHIPRARCCEPTRP